MSERKTKNMRRYSWDPASTVTVEVEEVDHWSADDRAFEVYYNGEKIGKIESGMHQSSRHLFGNVAHYYKNRRKWFARAPLESSMYGIDYESQAAAIRHLLSSAGVR